MFNDFMFYLSNDILAKVDRAAMGLGLETRVPMLDEGLIEYAWTLPEHMKINNGQGKVILKKLLDKYRRNDGHYDCLVPGSGGKDSAYQSHVLKYKYGMNPLTITWAPNIFTRAGWNNFNNPSCVYYFPII